MKRLIVLLGLALALASGVVWADVIPPVVGPTTDPTWVRTVFNDNGSSIVSGEIVAWESTSNSYRRSGYPYVVKTTTADSAFVAGVVSPGLTCPDQTLCEIVVRGVTPVKVADATDPFVASRLVSTSTVSGQAGDYTAAADTCFLGMVPELRDIDNGIDTNRDGSRMMVDVNVGCE